MKNLFLAFLGPDGCGKSTIAEKVANRINKKEAGRAIVIHFRPLLLPNINELLTGKKFEVPLDGVILPHTHPSSGYFMSLFRFFYYFFDFTVGQFVKIRPLLKSGKTVIYDRHFYDFITDPLRSRIKLPQWFFHLSIYLVPRPDFVFFFSGSPETLRQRKQELTLEEICRQLKDYRALLPRLKNACEIPNEGPIDEVIEKVNSVIENHLKIPYEF